MRKKLINRVTYDDVINFDIKDVFNIYKEYSNQELPNIYKKFSFGRALIEKAEGSLLTDYNGKKVFDCKGVLRKKLLTEKVCVSGRIFHWKNANE